MENKFTNALEFFKNAAKSVFLVPDIWKENTTALLHGPREADKTLAAINIAIDLTAAGREVLYVDTRSRLADHVELIKNEDRLLIFTPAYDTPDDPADYADLVISGIEQAVTTTDIRTFIVDSVTRIAALSFGRNASVAYVMKRLASLQVRYKISLLVIADDTTRATDRALLNLADCEIIESPEPLADIDTRPDTTFAPLQPDSTPLITTTLTRQQRRALQRRQAKLARRKATL